jgi:hypothetical protein
MLVVPRPVVFAALNHLTAAGGVEPAGNARFELLTLFVGSVQVEPAPHAVAGLSPVMVEADVGNMCPAPSLNWVDVTVRFQPPPELMPRASTTLTGSVYAVVWSAPLSVRLNDGGAPFPATESVLPETTAAFTVTVAASADTARTAVAVQRAAMRRRVCIGLLGVSTPCTALDRGNQ